jgi:hypothetical protein
MEHANELLAMYCHKCIGTFLGEHCMDEVQIDASHEVSFPATNTIVIRWFSFALFCLREVILVAACCDCSVNVCQELAT